MVGGVGGEGGGGVRGVRGEAKEEEERGVRRGQGRRRIDETGRRREEGGG